MTKHVIRISEAEATTNFADVLSRVRAGVEVVIEHNAKPVAYVHPAEPESRSISQCIALLKDDSTAVVDADFAKDVEAAVESHREPLNPPAWE